MFPRSDNPFAIHQVMRSLGHQVPRPLWFSRLTPHVLIDQDVRRIKEDWLGHKHVYNEASIIVDIGGRSGFFGIFHAFTLPSSHVIIVEPNPELRSAIEATVAASGAENITIIPSESGLPETIDTISAAADNPVGMIKVEDEHANSRVLAAIEDCARSFTLRYLCGAFRESDVDPLEIFRVSRRVSGTYFWHNLDTGARIFGEQCGTTAPEVSVVVPVFQVEAFLERCLESLSAQTLQDREIIVIDDESTDRSNAIAKEWAEQDRSIRVVRQRNQGCAASRSRGLREARGLYVAFVDGDDWVEPEMLETLLRAAVANGAQLAQGRYRECYEGDEVTLVPEPNFGLSTSHTDARVVSDPGSIIPGKPTIWRRLYSRSFLMHRGIDFYSELRRFDDLPFQFQTLMDIDKVAMSDRIVYNYRLGRQGQDVAVTDRRLFIHFRIFQLLRKPVAEKGVARFERLLRHVQLNTHRWGYERLVPELRKDYLVLAAEDLFSGRLMLTRWQTIAALWQRAAASRGKYWLLRTLSIAIVRGYLWKRAAYELVTEE